MWVTCYTDASWNPSKSEGAVAYWLRSDQGRIVDSTACPPQVTCNNTAEMCAILLGVRRALREWRETEGICVNTDSQVAITYLKYGADTSSLRREDWFVWRRWLHNILDKRNCRVRFKHVKAHQAPSNVRHYLNNQVDSISRAVLNAQKV